MQELKPSTPLQGGEYRIKRKLGQGGFGITYLAEQTLLKREIAIKEFFMKDSCVRDPQTGQVSVPTTGSTIQVERYRNKFLKEAQSLATMAHPHIISVIDLFERNGTVYYSMPYLPNGSLKDLVDRHGRLSEEEAVKYVSQIGSALKYMHEVRHTCHLDVKPANILLDEHHNAVLIDFGISKNYDNEGKETSTTPVGMSEGYAPIEQYAQQMDEFSPASDVYALGATLYFLIMGKTPPSAIRLSQGDQISFDYIVSENVRMAITRAMEFRVKDRPKSIDLFLEPLSYYSTVKRDSDESTTVKLDDMNDDEATMLGGHLDIISNDDIITQIVHDMVLIKGGTFEMGRRTVLGGGTHKVSLSDFYISKYQVTQEQWRAVMGSEPSSFDASPKLPVEQVSWEDCQEFITKLNQMTGKTFRLPSEAEWEFAARGGNEGKGYKFSGSQDCVDVAWYATNSNSMTHPVGTKKPNELGLFDMSGNVWEWCNDWFSNYYDTSLAQNPQGPKTGNKRVIRGGGYSSGYGWLGVSMRDSEKPSTRLRTIGFRLAL